jgi:hypothetical protein
MVLTTLRDITQSHWTFGQAFLTPDSLVHAGHHPIAWFYEGAVCHAEDYKYEVSVGDCAEFGADFLWPLFSSFFA